MEAVPQHDLAHVADAGAVNQHRAAFLHAPDDARDIFADFHNVADFRPDDVFRRPAHVFRHFGVAVQHPVLAVNRHHILRLDQVQHQL